MTTPLPNVEFDKSKYTDLPYLNINVDEANSKNIMLEELFGYQKLSIPDDAGEIDETYSILNIKKQFICVKFQKPSAGGGTPAGPEQSRIYVKKPVIPVSLKNKLPLINIGDKTIPGEIVFNENGEPTANSSKEEDEAGLVIFNEVYKKIKNDERPYFADVNNQFQGGNKRGGTRKVGGSRSR